MHDLAYEIRTLTSLREQRFLRQLRPRTLGPRADGREGIPHED